MYMHAIRIHMHIYIYTYTYTLYICIYIYIYIYILYARSAASSPGGLAVAPGSSDADFESFSIYSHTRIDQYET